MKRVGGLFERFCSFSNLHHAARRAQRGKRYRPDVLRFNHRREDALHELAEDLRNGRWRPGPHRHFRVHEPKTRWISAAPYPDRVVHHALCNVMGPVLEARLIFDCWANRVGKGSHRAVLRYQAYASRHRYALKLDIRKYFPSIDHEILKGQLRRVFKEPRLLDVMDRIIDGGSVPEPHLAYFPGDDLFTPYERQSGLPIGNLTSQLWANSFMTGFDHWVKRELGAGAYLRFVDDFVVLDDEAARLRVWRDAIGERLAPTPPAPHQVRGPSDPRGGPVPRLRRVALSNPRARRDGPEVQASVPPEAWPRLGRRQGEHRRLVWTYPPRGELAQQGGTLILQHA